MIVDLKEKAREGAEVARRKGKWGIESKKGGGETGLSPVTSKEGTMGAIPKEEAWAAVAASIETAILVRVSEIKAGGSHP